MVGSRVAFNNVGITIRKPFHEYTAEEFGSGAIHIKRGCVYVLKPTYTSTVEKTFKSDSDFTLLSV